MLSPEPGWLLLNQEKSACGASGEREVVVRCRVRARPTREKR
jgi:hypothetical protein